MKRNIFILSALLLVFCQLCACSEKKQDTPPQTAITTYKDIPGITEEEISRIESLKETVPYFNYGTLLSVESYISDDGSYEGFSVKLCGFLSEIFGMEFRVNLYEWDELIDKLEAHEIDFTGELTMTEERLQKYSMTRPIAERLLRIFTLENNNIVTEADAEGMRIGFLEDTVTADAILRAYNISFIPVYVPDYASAAFLISQGEIDAFVDEAVADPAFEPYSFITSKIMFSMVHEPVSITTANPELAVVVSLVNQLIDAGGGNTLYELYSDSNTEYAKYKLNGKFSKEEKAYIKDLTQRGISVPVLCEKDSYPSVFYNDTEKEFEGIAIDILTEITELTGLRFEVAHADDILWSDMMEKVETGDMPMLAELLHTETREEHFLWGAVPYARSYYAIMSRIDHPYLAAYQVAQTSVGVMKMSGYEDVYREMFPDYDNLVYYDTLDECLDALDSGEVDLIMGSEHMLLTQMNYREKSGLKVNIKFNVSMDSHFGFYKDETILCSIVDKAQQYVETDKIEMGWVGRMFDYSKRLAEERVFYLTVFTVALAAILIAAVFLLIRNVKLDKKLKDMANNDALTGIYNRRFFIELCGIQMERSRRTKTECYMVMFDLDHFKAVNDTYGHLAGDRVLKDIAQRIKNSIRPYDILGRYGGEEFVILLTGESKNPGPEDIINTTERLRLEVCSTPVEFEKQQIPVSASFGISKIDLESDISESIKRADEALYRAKEEGRNRVIFC